MKKTIILPIKALSVNETYCRNRSHKTTAANQWEQVAHHYLSKHKEALHELRDFYDPKKHRFIIHMITYYPKEIIFTKKDTPSSRAKDVSNVEKSMQDMLFHKDFLSLDDKYVFDLHSYKRPSDKFAIKLRILISSSLVTCHFDPE